MLTVFRRWWVALQGCGFRGFPIWWWLRRLRAQWIFWRRGLLPLGASIRLLSFRVGSAEQMVDECPGTMFSPNSYGVELRMDAATAGIDISIVVKNVAKHPVVFSAVVMMRMPDCMYGLPWPPTRIEPDCERRLTIRPLRGGVITSLRIPEFFPKKLLKAPA